MRSAAVLAVALLGLCLPAPALAGNFIVPFGSGTSMGLAGWSGKADAGAICGYEGNSTIFLNAGTLPAHSGCFLIFNAPAAAGVVAVNVRHGWTKASPATALCAYSHSAQPGGTMRRCAGGTYDDAFAASGSNWVQIGLYNESGSPISLTTARANNIVYLNGGVTLSDPTPPIVAATAPTGVQNGGSAPLTWCGVRRRERGVRRPATRSTAARCRCCAGRPARGSAARRLPAARASTSAGSPTDRTR